MSTPGIDRIIETARQKNPASDSGLLRRAYELAERAHQGQTRASKEPYIVHPLAVAQTLAEMGLDDAVVAAGLLHDVIDDTAVTEKEIQKASGEEIAFLVSGVTKLGKIKYRGIERHVENLRKMFLAMAEDIRVVLIKLADRLHNMQTIAALPAQKQGRIALETLEVYSPLAGRLGIGEMKAQLDDLAFPLIYPKEHAWITEHVSEAYASRQKYCDRITPIVHGELTQNGLDSLAIFARAKHYYSLWLKLQRYNMDLSKVHDVVALRIIMPDVTACYAALGVLHNRWKPLAGRIKDYIAVPKPNGYQSIHTTVFCEDGMVTEFQIRTPQMHAQAEYGIAAHWHYAERGKESLKRPERFRWVEQLRDWQKEVRGTDEFLDALRIDFFRDRIFVFTPKGDVIELPEGASPVDFAYHIHSDIGNQAVGAKVNERFVGLDTTLNNGDVVEIIVQKGKKPTIKWLELARTSLARGQLRKALREQGIEVLPPSPTPLRAEITLGVEDRVGMLQEITNIVSRAGLNMERVEGRGEGEVGKIRLVVLLQSRSEFKKLLEQLQALKGVLDASGRII